MSKREAKRAKRDPLEVQLREDVDAEAAAAKARKASAKRASGLKTFGGGRADGNEDDRGADLDLDDGPDFLPEKVSKRILSAARKQAMEDDDDEDGDDDAGGGGKRRVRFAGSSAAPVFTSSAAAARGGGDDDDDEEGHGYGDDDEEEEIVEFADEDDVRLDGDYVDVRGMMAAAGGTTAEEEAILRRFMPDAPGQRRTLADIIMEKIKEKEEAAAEGQEAAAAASSSAAAATPAGLPPMDPKLVEVYAEVGRYLARYKSGKLPKVLKIVPALGNWEEVLFLTNPETWTPHATFAATRIFASAFNAAKAQRFFNLVLLPKCRDDIALHKRLNFHLYLALKKATYKPAAFYRGVILPLAASGDCTLREAVIFGSVIGKASLPALHSAATLMKLASLWPYAGAVSIFLRLLLNKKYTLAFIAVDAVVDHFMRFTEVEGPLPVIWHQALLALAQRYKADLTRAQKEGLKALMAQHAHHAITPEVRRELFSVGCRGEAPSVPAPGAGAGAASSAAAAATAPAAAGAAAGAGKGKKRPAPGSHAGAASASGASGDMLY